ILRTYEKKNQDETYNEQLVLHSPDTAIHIIEKQLKASHRLPNKSQQQFTKIRKNSILSELSKGGSNIPSTSILRSKDFSNSSLSSKSRITDFPSSSQLTETMSIKRKKSDELGSNELSTKRVKLNVNIQSVLEKVLDEQLKQRIAIDNLQKSNEELKQEISENHKLLQNTSMTKACHQLFQVNKNPSDTEVEQAFRSQIQADLSQMNGTICGRRYIQFILNLFSYKLNQFASPKEVIQWKRSERVKRARSNIWKKIDDKDPNSSCTIEAILQRAFTKEELQNKNNIKFGITVALMLLDLTYDQVEILSSKVQERMDQWDSNPIIQSWLENNTIDDNNEPSLHFDSEFAYFNDQESDSDNDVENEVYNNEDKKANKIIDAENTDSEN
ncbi:6604_t:CDS:2, partial [Funneliformis caledonium]